MKNAVSVAALSFALAISAQGSPLNFETYESTYSNQYSSHSTEGYTSPDGWLITTGTWDYQSSEGRFYWEGLHNADYSYTRNWWTDYSFSTTSAGTWVYGARGDSWFNAWHTTGESREFWENGEYNSDLLANGDVFRWGSNAFTEVLMFFSDSGAQGYNAEANHFWQESHFDQIYSTNWGGGSWNDPTPTPEPSTLLLFAGGLLGVAVKKLKRGEIV